MARKMHGIKNSLKKCRYLVGIDEVGRGPLAGPVTVCAFCIDTHKISVKKLITELNSALLVQTTQMMHTKKNLNGNSKKYKKRTVFDSKSITEDIREKIAQYIYLQSKSVNMKSEGRSEGGNEEVVHVGTYISIKSKTSSQIDAKGIAVCIRELVAEVLIDICKQVYSAQCDYKQIAILLDGGLYAPSEYLHQKTIIKGDAKESLIGIASILAKVHRDAYMKNISKKYPEYGFEVHKGYGTKNHRDSINRIGASKLHRKSFLRNFNNF